MEKLLEWASKTGYPAELYGASVLTASGFTIYNSYLYKDHEHQVHRELDLFASYFWQKESDKADYPGLIIYLLIECKKSDKPFILLSNNNNKPDYYLIGGNTTSEDLIALPVVKYPMRLFLPPKTSSGFKLIQSFSTSDEVIHKATSTLIKSYEDWTRDNNSIIDLHVKDNMHTLAMPVLLIDAPLYEMKLEAGELALHELDSCILKQKTHLLGYKEDEFAIPVVTKSKFQAFLKSVIEIGDVFYTNICNDPESQINSFAETVMADRKKRKKQRKKST